MCRVDVSGCAVQAGVALASKEAKTQQGRTTFTEVRPRYAVASICQFDLLSFQHPSNEVEADLLGESAGIWQFADPGLGRFATPGFRRFTGPALDRFAYPGLRCHPGCTLRQAGKPFIRRSGR